MHATTGRIPPSVAERIARWRDWRFGMFIHWGPVSIMGTEISWARNGTRGTDGCDPITGQIPTATYDSLYLQFNPTNFNATQWVDVISVWRSEFGVFIEPLWIPFTADVVRKNSQSG